jgi:CheY-like chemotaxis protein
VTAAVPSFVPQVTVPDPTAGYVLVVDDEPDVRDTLALVLDLSGIPAATAANGREALALLRSNPRPGAILLDLRMPVLDGEGFLAERAADPGLAAVPVVVCSATADADLRARLPGVAAYLHKPALPADLVATVRRVLPAG